MRAVARLMKTANTCENAKEASQPSDTYSTVPVPLFKEDSLLNT